jgi:hypothetical protein
LVLCAQQVSFHRYGDYFPGTGAVEDVGYGKGRGYCVNVPLKDGMDDESYRYVYEPIMTKVCVLGVCWLLCWACLLCMSLCQGEQQLCVCKGVAGLCLCQLLRGPNTLSRDAAWA